VSDCVIRCLQALQPNCLSIAAEVLAAELQRAPFVSSFLRLSIPQAGAVPAAPLRWAIKHRAWAPLWHSGACGIGSKPKIAKPVWQAALDALADWFGEPALSPVYEKPAVGF